MGYPLALACHFRLPRRLRCRQPGLQQRLSRLLLRGQFGVAGLRETSSAKVGSVGPRLVPHYDLLQQTSLDLQVTRGDWLAKMELVHPMAWRVVPPLPSPSVDDSPSMTCRTPICSLSPQSIPIMAPVSFPSRPIGADETVEKFASRLAFLAILTPITRYSHCVVTISCNASISSSINGRTCPDHVNSTEALDAAIGMFWTKGYKATSMADLMEATGLPGDEYSRRTGPARSRDSRVATTPPRQHLRIVNRHHRAGLAERTDPL